MTAKAITETERRLQIDSSALFRLSAKGGSAQCLFTDISTKAVGY
jgi:hypothetical protein